MQGYSAIVTGGAQGIGKAISAALIDAGMHALILDTDAEAGRETVQELKRSTELIFMHGDCADEATVKRAVARAHKLGQGLHAAVANAGIFLHGALETFALKDWNRMLAVNLTAQFLLAKYAAPRLRTNRGAMVLVSSTRAVMSEPHWEAYGATKGGIAALAHALAMSLGPEVRVNCVSPGWILTDAWHKRRKRRSPKLSKQDHAQHPAGRAGRPEDIGALVRYLLSPDAGFITGSNFVADGGMTRKMNYV